MTYFPAMWPSTCHLGLPLAFFFIPVWRLLGYQLRPSPWLGVGGRNSPLFLSCPLSDDLLLLTNQKMMAGEQGFTKYGVRKCFIIMTIPKSDLHSDLWVEKSALECTGNTSAHAHASAHTHIQWADATDLKWILSTPVSTRE